MKKSILMITVIVFLLTTMTNISFAQTRFDKPISTNDITKWRDHSDELPGTEKNAVGKALLIVGAVVAVAAVTYFIVSSLNDTDETVEENPAAEETSMDISTIPSLSSVIHKNKSNLESNCSPIKLFMASQANFMNSNSTNYSLGIKYNF